MIGVMLLLTTTIDLQKIEPTIQLHCVGLVIWSVRSGTHLSLYLFSSLATLPARTCAAAAAAHCRCAVPCHLWIRRTYVLQACSVQLATYGVVVPHALCVDSGS